MRNGTERRSTTSVRAHNPRHQGGNDIVARIPSGVREARKRMSAWRQEFGRQIEEHPGRSVALAVGAGYLLGGGLFSRLTVRLLGAGMRIGLRILVPFVTRSIVTDYLNPDKKEIQP